MILKNKYTGNTDAKLFQFESNGAFNLEQESGLFSLIWIQSGNGIVSLGSEKHKFSRKTLITLTPYQSFNFEVTNKLKGTVINFHPDFFCVYHHNEQVACDGVLFNTIYNPPILEVDKQTEIEFLEIFKRIRFEISEVALANQEMLVSNIKILLILASRLKSAKLISNNKGIDVNDQELSVIQNLKNLIEINYKVLRSPSHYAKLLNTSTKSLRNLTKRHFEKTLSDIILERVVIEAKKELYLTKKSIKQIAHGLGYFDEHYFSRFFKKKVGVSPKKYRANLKSKFD